MAIVLPSAEWVNSLALADAERQFVSIFCRLLAAYPQNRLLWWAGIFCLRRLGISSRLLGEGFGCSDRRIRQIVSAVQASQHGAGKTGRPSGSPMQATKPPSEVLGYSVYAGLWLLVPWVLESRLWAWCQLLSFAVPVVAVTPWQLVMTVLVLAWAGFTRLHHLNDVCDIGVALLTGRRTVLDESRAHKALKAIPKEAGQAFYTASAQAEWEDIEAPQPWVSVDEHTVGHQGGPNMRKAKVPRFGRVRAAHQLFGTFVLGVRRFVGLAVGQANSRLSQVAVDRLREARHHQQTVQPQAQGLRAILDRGSYAGPTHQHLDDLKAQGIRYVALVRRTKNNVAYWDNLLFTDQLDLAPFIHHHDLKLPEVDRRRSFWLATCHTPIKDCDRPLPTILIIDEDKFYDADPKAKYVAAFFATLDWPAGLTTQVYPWRQEHELAYRDVIHALGFDALPKGYSKDKPRLPLRHPEQSTSLDTKDIFSMTWLRMLAYNRVTEFLAHLPAAYQHLTVLTAARKFLRRPGLLLVHDGCLVVQLDPFPDSHALTGYLNQLNARRLTIPWLSGLVLRIEVASHPAAQTSPPAEWRKLLSAVT